MYKYINTFTEEYCLWERDNCIWQNFRIRSYQELTLEPQRLLLLQIITLLSFHYVGQV